MNYSKLCDEHRWVYPPIGNSPGMAIVMPLSMQCPRPPDMLPVHLHTALHNAHLSHLQVPYICPWLLQSMPHTLVSPLDPHTSQGVIPVLVVWPHSQHLTLDRCNQQTFCSSHTFIVWERMIPHNMQEHVKVALQKSMHMRGCICRTERV